MVVKEKRKVRAPKGNQTCPDVRDLKILLGLFPDCFTGIIEPEGPNFVSGLFPVFLIF